MRSALGGVALLALLGACSQEQANNEELSKRENQKLYTKESGKYAFSQALKLSDEEEDFRILGKSFFTKPWVESPAATTARDGLGPLFSANSCIHCHPHNGAGLAQEKNGETHRSLVMHLSLFSESNLNNDLIMKNGFIIEPTYGAQLSINGTSDVKYEGSVSLSYMQKELKYSDGESYRLHEPHYTLTDLQYGPLHKDTNVAPHIALALIGLGAIEEIDEEDILLYEDAQDRDKDGISGRANWVFNPETNATELGRFTWKAAAATLKQQVANAAHNDMGLTNPLYPNENCTESQKECQEAPKGRGEFDLPMQRVDAITYYLKTLKIPAQRRGAEFAAGREIFQTLGCAKCHVESFKTKQYGTIHPYSDFLLHDMGEALSDGHRMFKAEPNEFRTPPLWGIGLYESVSGELNLLHDGRAKSIEEAILWHGGEAQTQKMAFRALDKNRRETLIEFLKGI